MSLLLYLLKYYLIIVYFFIKLFTKQTKQVLFLSRQSNDISINYKLLMERLDKKGIKYKFICKKVDTKINDGIRTNGTYSTTKKLIVTIITNIGSVFNYFFSLHKQMKEIAKSKIVFVDGYNLPVSLLCHKKNTTIIQTWHALGSVKKIGYQVVGKKDGIPKNVARILKMHCNYNYALSGSEEMRYVFADAFKMPIDNVLAIGAPVVDYINSKKNKSIKEIYIEYPQLKGKKNILYSPTFRNDKYDNNDELIKHFGFDKFNLIIMNHPKVETSCTDERVVYIPNDRFTIFDVTAIADYVITDYSATMIDAAVANKKFLLYVYDYDEYTRDSGLNIDLMGDWPTLTYKKIEELFKVIEKNEYDIKAFENFKKKYTLKKQINSTDEIMKIVYKCL